MSTKTSISGLTDEEAQEFHHYWMQGTVGFTAVAVLAHILVWAWRPWFWVRAWFFKPLIDGVTVMQNTTHLNEDHSRADESPAFWSIFIIGFGCLFVVVVLAKLVGVHWRDLLPGAEDAKSMSQGVKAAVYTFMSHII
jgi:light-harvesting complex 1 beta chain